MPVERRWTSARVEKMKAEGEVAQDKFERTRSALRELVTGHDALEVLARVAFSMFMRIASLQRDPTLKGVEVWHVEILQALALSAPRRTDSDERIDYAGLAQASIDLLEDNGQAYRKTWLRKVTADPASNDQLELISLLRDWTMAIRGSRHGHQTEELSRALATAVDPAFRREHDCNPDEFVTTMLGAIATLDGRMRSHLEWVKSWIRKRSGIAMIEAFTQPIAADVAARIEADLLPHRYDRRKVESLLWAISEDRLVTMLTFTAEELLAPANPADPAPLTALINGMSLNFGEIDDNALQHILLDNPTKLKPFIALGDGRYFLANPHSLGMNAAEILQDICNRAPGTKVGTEDMRAEWLESKLHLIVSTFFPHADIRRSVKWSDPVDNRGYESDVIAMIDKTIIVFEAKSAKIDGPARRGALNSLKGALRKLVVEPSNQSARFKRMLEAATGKLVLKSDDGDFEIDADIIRDVIRVNVVLDAVGPLSAHWPRLKNAGLIPNDAEIAPTMSVFELETVLESLTMEVERCHYLSRRGELEKQVTYVADELDLLAFYIENQFNVQSTRLGGELWLYGKSAEVALGYSEAWMAGKLSIPIKRTPTWQALLRTIEEKRPIGWTRFGHRLLNFDLAAQRGAERALRQGWRQVSRAKDSFFTTGVTAGEGDRASTVSLVIGPTPNPATFQSNLAYAANSAFDQGGQRDLLLIYWFSPRTGEGYDFIGTLRRAELPLPQLQSMKERN